MLPACVHLEDLRGREIIPFPLLRRQTLLGYPQTATLGMRPRLLELNRQSTISHRSASQHTYGVVFRGFRPPSRSPSEAYAAKRRLDYPNAIDLGACGHASRHSRQARRQARHSCTKANGFFPNGSRWRHVQIRPRQTVDCLSAPTSSDAPARSNASRGRGCTSTEARSHTRSKVETAIPTLRLGSGRPRHTVVCDCLAHALLDLKGVKCIPVIRLPLN